MFEMMYEANFTYDSSMPVYENKPPAFPYTMDYKMPHDCMIPPCPEKAYPGKGSILCFVLLISKPSGKLRRLTPSFGCIFAIRLKKYFFRNIALMMIFLLVSRFS